MNLITPNMIPTKYFVRFKELYLKHFGIELSDEEATRAALDLINLMRVLLKPGPKIIKTK